MIVCCQLNSKADAFIKHFQCLHVLSSRINVRRSNALYNSCRYFTRLKPCFLKKFLRQTDEYGDTEKNIKENEHGFSELYWKLQILIGWLEFYVPSRYFHSFRGELPQRARFSLFKKCTFNVSNFKNEYKAEIYLYW